MHGRKGEREREKKKKSKIQSQEKEILLEIQEVRWTSGWLLLLVLPELHLLGIITTFKRFSLKREQLHPPSFQPHRQLFSPFILLLLTGADPPHKTCWDQTSLADGSQFAVHQQQFIVFLTSKAGTQQLEQEFKLGVSPAMFRGQRSNPMLGLRADRLKNYLM